MYPLRGNQDPVPRLHHRFLAPPPLSLHPLPSLISTCPMNLPFGTQGRSWRLESVPYEQGMRDTDRLPCPEAPQGAARFHAHQGARGGSGGVGGGKSRQKTPSWLRCKPSSQCQCVRRLILYPSCRHLIITQRTFLKNNL